MKKKLIALLLSGSLCILPVGSAFAEELSSGDETMAVLDESADPESEAVFLTEEITSPQEETSTTNEILETEADAPEDVLSAGASEEIIEGEVPAAGAYNAISLQQPKLIAAYNGAKGIGLKFYKVNNAAQYVLYRKFNGVWNRVCTFNATDPSLQISGNTIMYTDTSVAKNYGKGYIYSVAARNGSRETTYDTKGAAIYRLTPPNLTAATSSVRGKATITWKGVFGRTETNGTYDLQIAEYKNGQAGTFQSLTTLPGYNNLTLKTTVTGLKKGSRYVFRIRCAKTNKDRGTYYSEYSKWLSVTIPTMASFEQIKKALDIAYRDRGFVDMDDSLWNNQYYGTVRRIAPDRTHTFAVCHIYVNPYTLVVSEGNAIKIKEQYILDLDNPPHRTS